jgi:hypothetical protein
MGVADGPDTEVTAAPAVLWFSDPSVSGDVASLDVAAICAVTVDCGSDDCLSGVSLLRWRDDVSRCSAREPDSAEVGDGESVLDPASGVTDRSDDLAGSVPEADAVLRAVEPADVPPVGTAVLDFVDGPAAAGPGFGDPEFVVDASDVVD